ncbi:MAG: phosphoadenosine phosphosulfate reductase [Saprospiraceae bacterium]|jgi:phosphoadenosine phosphosulfate reductase
MQNQSPLITGHDSINKELTTLSAQQRAAWAFEHLPTTHVLTSSFGIQSAVMLHMVTRIQSDIPVILIDTGYLFEETYQFIEALSKRLSLNLQVIKPIYTPVELEKHHGQLWLTGEEGIAQYNQITKVEPMQRALQSTQAQTWFSGLRAQQSKSRQALSPLEMQDGRYKILPIIDWSNRDVHLYMKQHDLPYHPLWEEGYVSVGDTHTSKPLSVGMLEEETRFFGLQRECGIHSHQQAV